MAVVKNTPEHDYIHEHSIDESTSIVKEENRSSRWSLAMAWWGVCSALFYMVVGIAMAKNYGTKNAIIGIILTVITYSIINGIISKYAIRTGLSVTLFSRALFGRFGAGLATLIFFMTAIYYAVFEGSVIALAVNHMNSNIAYWLASVVIVLYSVPLIFGTVQNWLDKFNGFLLPLYLLGLIGSCVYATYEYGYSSSWLSFGPDNPPAYGWWDAFVYYMGVYVLMMFTFDFARFGKSEDSKFHAYFTFGIPFYIVVFLLSGLSGIYLVNIVPNEGVISELSVAFVFIELIGIWGLVFIWITQTRINTANYFLATTNMQAFFEIFKISFSKYVWAIVVGIIVFILMLQDVFSYLLQALAYQGIFVVAWVGIALAHILFKDKGVVPEIRQDKVPNFDAGVLAWFISSAIGVIMYHASWGTNWYGPATLILAALVYIVMKKDKAKR